MKAASFLLLLLSVHATELLLSRYYNNEPCKTKHLSEPKIAPSLQIEQVIASISLNISNLTELASEVLQRHRNVWGLMLSDRNLTLKTHKGVKFYSSKDNGTQEFWNAYKQGSEGWLPPFRDCGIFPRTWFYTYVDKKVKHGFGIFVPLQLNQCDSNLEDIFGGSHKCDPETTFCIPRYEYGERRGGYRCSCLEGFYHQEANVGWIGFDGEEIENDIINSSRCLPCPLKCDTCERGGICAAKKTLFIKTVVLGLQSACMIFTVIMALVVFKQRKCKAIASGMWTILETILLGIFILYSTVIVHVFEPSVLQCLLEPWARELGFIICYGAIILKLYRHLIEFRTRKAHRWVVKDTDLLKYLLIMTVSVFAYMAAYTSTNLNFVQENYSLLENGLTSEGLYYVSCKPLWWDYVTEVGELTILVFGIHLGYACRNARTQFHERRFLCAAISIELAISMIFYISRILILPSLHPDIVLFIYFIRTQLSATLTLLLVFIPKFMYQQKQVRSLAQEYSCRIDAFKDVNAHGPLSGNNSDADAGEVTLADMSPDDIRAELKRLYMQLEIFKNKTICRDNPHISKRRGGRKAAHRRFSLQKKGSREKNLHGKHRPVQKQEETTEAEPSRTPEDSVCSNEGPSAIYADLPSHNAP